MERFHDIVIANPEKAAEELPNYLGKVLSAGDGLFSGTNCGGPFEGVTAPLLDTVGMVYPCLERQQREKALISCLNFLDGLRYDNSQRNVELINEPWLIGDIVSNRHLYWCGFKEYEERQKKCVTWDDWKTEFISEDGKFNANSIGWLAISTFWKDYAAPEVREGFSKSYPDLVERAQDAMAGNAYAMGVCSEYEENPLPQEEIREFLSNFEPEFASVAQKKTKKDGNFILLESTVARYASHKEWRERDKQRR
jgi:hypothetical protein